MGAEFYQPALNCEAAEPPSMSKFVGKFIAFWAPDIPSALFKPIE